MKRPFCAIGGSFLAAAFLASFLTVSVQVIILIACTLAFFFALVFLKGAHRSYTAVFFFCAAAAFGSFLAKDQLSYRPVTVLDQASASVQGTITNIDQRTNHRYAYTLLIPKGGTEYDLPPFSMILYTDSMLDAECYDEVYVTADFFLPESSESFNSVRYYKSDGIYLLASLHDETPVTVKHTATKPIRYHLEQLNQSLCKTIDQRIPSPEAGILKSLVLGNRDDISFSLKQDYTNAGIVHLLAISGVHVSILAGFLYLIFSRLKINRRIGAIVQILLIIGFILLSGIQVSAVRAGGMILVLLAGRLLYRRADSLNSLCCAGFFIVLSNVYAIMDIGFLMSFCATLGILLCCRPISGWVIQKLGITGRISVKTVELISLSFSANLFLIPIYVGVFGTLSIISVIANIFVNIIASAELILGFFLIFLFLFPLPAILTAPLCSAETFLIRIQNKIAVFFGDLPFSTIGLNNDAVVLWMISSILILTAVFCYRKRNNLFRPAFVLITALFILTNAISLFFTADHTRICIIGDGKTSNIILIDRFNATVISTKDDDYIDERTYSFLQSNGIHRISNLILAYPDFELYEDTLNLTEAMPVGNVFYHRENTLCHLVLQDKTAGIGAISEHMRLKTNDHTIIDFSYAGSKLGIKISCKGINLLISNFISEIQKEKPDLCMLTGSVYQPATQLGSKHLILLQKQYDPVVSDQKYQEAYRESTEYIVTEQGELIQKEKEGFSWLF